MYGLVCAIFPFLFILPLHLVVLLFMLFLLLAWSFPFGSTPFGPTSRDPVARFVTIRTIRLTAIMRVIVRLPVSLHGTVGHCDGFLVSFNAMFVFYSTFNFGRSEQHHISFHFRDMGSGVFSVNEFRCD